MATESTQSDLERAAFNFGKGRYVPNLLTRQGERLALRELSEDVKDRMTPIFTVHPIDRDPETREPKASLSSHLRKASRDLARDWGSKPAFLDLRHVYSDETIDGLLGIAWMIHECDRLGLPLMPAISQEHPPAYRNAAVAAARDIGTAVMIVLGPDQWARLGTPLADGLISRLLDEAGGDPARIHLMMNMGPISGQASVQVGALTAALARVPFLNDWASITIAGTGMPATTGHLGADSEAEVPRFEWQVWLQVRGATTRALSFGDYGVQHPDPLSGFDPRFMDSSAQLRYTIPEAWFIVRGRGVRNSGYEQIAPLAAKVVAHPNFSGQDFSPGDAWIANCASRTVSTGNQGLWRKATTSHHLVYVTSQLANLALR